MKKRSSLFAVMMLLSAFVFGQVKSSNDFKVSTGTPYRVIDGTDKKYFAVGNGQTISIKTQGKLVFIQKYDSKSMKELGRKEYEDFPKKFEVQDVIQVGDNLHYLYMLWNKKEKKHELYSREIDTKKGVFLKSKLVVSAGGKVFPMTAKSNFFTKPGAANVNQRAKDLPIFKVDYSFDQSKVLIRYRLKPESRRDSKNKDILGFHVFSPSMEKVWGSEATMPHTEAEMDNLAFAVSSEGTAYMLSYLRENKAFELITVKGDKLLNKKLGIDAKLNFQEFKINEDKEGNLTCAGFYANGIDFKVSWTGNAAFSFNTNGILHFTIDKEGNLISSNDYEFPIELINQYATERQQEKNAKREEDGKLGIADLKLLEFITYEDGGALFIGEQQYTRVKGSGDNQRTVYYYGHLVVTKVDGQGNIVWMKKLPKDQMGGRGKGGLSISYIEGNNAHYLLFLDNVKNANLPLDKVPARHVDNQGGFLTAYKIDDASGDVSRRSLFDLRDINGVKAYQFTTTRIFKVADKVFMTEIYIKGKEDTMVKTVLND